MFLRTFAAAFIGVLAMAGCSSSSSEAVEPIEEGTFFMRDDAGRVVILHGFDYEGEYPYLQDPYVAVWVEVAKRFADHPAVIGYDIMNEPSPGSALDARDFTLTPPDGDAAEFDRTLLADFYQRVIDAIREVGA